MLTRRRFLGYSALTSAMLAYRPLLRPGMAQAMREGQHPLRLAILGNSYTEGSQLQGIADCFLAGYPENGKWHVPNVQVVSLYMQPAEEARAANPARPAPNAATAATRTARRMEEPSHPRGAQSWQLQTARRAPAEPAEIPGDLSAGRASEFGFRRCQSIAEALRGGGDQLAVDAVLVVLDPGEYARNDKGQVLYPSDDFLQQCAQVFEEDGRAVPYFNHGRLSHSFRQAQSMVATAERLKFPLMGGCSLPLTWRLPDVDVPLGGQLQEAVMVGIGSYDGTDYDSLEAMQAMVERRKGGETGVKAVQLLEGDDVWAAADAGHWPKELLSSALSRSDSPQGLTNVDGRTQDLTPEVLLDLVQNPAAYCIEYNDGTRATMLLLNGAVQSYTFSTRVAGQGLVSTEFLDLPAPNYTYSACLATKIEELFVSGRAPYPLQRSLLTSGVLEACLTSRANGHQRVETPHLAVKYQPPTESQYRRT